MKVAEIFKVFILIAKARSKKRVSVSTGMYSPQPHKCFKIFFFQDDENLALNSESHVQSGSSQDGKWMHFILAFFSAIAQGEISIWQI